MTSSPPGERGWYRGDCHVHSVRSGDEMTPAELAAAARDAGLDFVVATERNATADREAWTAEELLVIFGQEVATSDGHWLAFGLPPGFLVDWHHPASSGLEAEIERVRRAGGLCVVAHPFAPYPTGTFRFPCSDFDAIEVWNGLWSSGRPWNADNEAALASWVSRLPVGVAAGRWQPAIGSSDTHRRGQLGLPHTVVRAAEKTPAALLAGLRDGRCWIAVGPEVDVSLVAARGQQRAGIGDRLPAGEQSLSVRATATGVPSGTVTIHTERGVVVTASLPARGAAEVDWSPADGQPSFVRVEVRDADGRMAALTNPIVIG